VGTFTRSFPEEFHAIDDTVSCERGTAVVTHDPAKVTVAQMIDAIRTLKYTASVVASAAR